MLYEIQLIRVPLERVKMLLNGLESSENEKENRKLADARSMLAVLFDQLAVMERRESQR